MRKKILIALSIFVLFFGFMSFSNAEVSRSSVEKIGDMIAGIVENVLIEFEAMKVGGKENYQIMVKILNLDTYKKAQKISLENAAKSVGIKIDYSNINDFFNKRYDISKVSNSIGIIKIKILEKFDNFEAFRIGGKENYYIMLQFLNSEKFKIDQKKLLETSYEHILDPKNVYMSGSIQEIK